MANLDIFDRGEDIPRTATLVNSDDSSIFDTSTFDTIEVSICHKFSRIEIGNYTLAGGTITLEIPTTSGEITWIIADTETDDAQTGIYIYEVTTTETDADYVGGVRTRKFIGDCFILQANYE